MLIRRGLVDEYHLWVFPLVFGQGKRLLADGTIPASLRLVDSKISTTGVFMGTYEPAGEVVTGRSKRSPGEPSGVRQVTTGVDAIREAIPRRW